jgi:diguanylate cyclase (GGDEF)-like protein
MKRKRPRNSRNRDLTAENRRLRKELKEASLRDHLTGLYTYHYLIERLDIELKHAKKYMFPFSIVMLDIDYFKSINDTYGHRAGNTLLKKFARYLAKFVRDTDVLIRSLGAEFAILLPDTEKDHAVAFAQRLCANLQKRQFTAGRIKIKLKVSIGVVNFPKDKIGSVAGLIDALDKSVLAAKDGGGNRVCSFDSIPDKEKAELSKKEEVEELKASLKKTGKRLDQALLESIYAFAKAIEARDHYTGEHAEEMIDIVRGIGKELGLAKKKITSLEHAAVLHDLGKIGIDDKILRKKGKLTKKEYVEIQKHPLIGAEILRSIHFLREVVPYILYHHERYDGKGYAEGLKGNDIPLGARILAIADVYQALTSDSQIPHREGLLELTWNYGTEKEADFKYHNGNDQPQGFGHLCT